MKTEPYVTNVGNERARWLDAIPIKKYPHHTLFYINLRNGNGYYESFLNSEIEIEKRKRGMT